MNLEKYGAVIPAILFFYLFASGYRIVDPLPLTYDPALHAEIAAYIIPDHPIPATWAPLADVQYTYPPLFHWSSRLLSLSGAEPYKVVMFFGLFLYALFPAAFYLYGSSFGRTEAVLFSFFGAVQASLMEVFAAGEYPQLLSMNLALVALYFAAEKKYRSAGLVTGLVALSHSFTAVYLLAALAVYYIAARIGNGKQIRGKDALVFLVSALAVSAIWIPSYLRIAGNAVNHRWENTIWYYQPGFIGLDRINDIFFSLMPGARAGIVMLALALAGAAYFHKRQMLLPRCIFLFTIAFTLFHIPGTQYKFPDMLSVAIPPMAAFGAIALSQRMKNLRPFAKAVALLPFIFLLASHPYINAVNMKNCCVSNDIPDGPLVKAAAWLRTNDSSRSVLFSDGKHEAWVALIAGKYPMNPRVSELEAFTDRYRQMLSDRDAVIAEIGNGTDPSDLLEKWGVKYVITKKELLAADYRAVWRENGVNLFKRSA